MTRNAGTPLARTAIVVVLLLAFLLGFTPRATAHPIARGQSSFLGTDSQFAVQDRDEAAPPQSAPRLDADSRPVWWEVHTYFVASKAVDPAVWVHNASFDAARLARAAARVKGGRIRMLGDTLSRFAAGGRNLADTLMKNVGGPIFDNMRHHMHKFEIMKKQYGVMGKKFAEKAERAKEIIREVVGRGGGRFGPPVGQGAMTALYYEDQAATYVFKPTGELWSIRSNLGGH